MNSNVDSNSDSNSNAISHAKERISARYGVKLTKTLDSALMKRVHDGRAKTYPSYDRFISTAVYDGILYKFVHDTSQIITFLPTKFETRILKNKIKKRIDKKGREYVKLYL